VRPDIALKPPGCSARSAPAGFTRAARHPGRVSHQAGLRLPGHEAGGRGRSGSGQPRSSIPGQTALRVAFVRELSAPKPSFRMSQPCCRHQENRSLCNLFQVEVVRRADSLLARWASVNAPAAARGKSLKLMQTSLPEGDCGINRCPTLCGISALCARSLRGGS
jgi:hypothetical protein